jgi:hypothetical protein
VQVVCKRRHGQRDFAHASWFLLIALAHVARLVFGAAVVVQDFPIRYGSALLAVVLMGFLAYQGFRLARKSGSVA